jgi:hypothetical protein
VPDFNDIIERELGNEGGSGSINVKTRHVGRGSEGRLAVRLSVTKVNLVD